MELNRDFSPKAKEDFALVGRAQEGDEIAFATLLKRYYDSIYFLLLKMVNNPIDAEDLTIEAFGKAFRNIHKYKPDFAFSTWLFRIASNNGIDFIRKYKNKDYTFQPNSEDLSQTREDAENYGMQLESTHLKPDEVLITKEKAIRLKLVVEELKPRYRKLLELRYYEEYSYEEISANLGIPIGTVKAQLFRARRLLYDILKDKHQNL